MYWLWLFCLYSFLGYLLEKIFAAVTGSRHQVRKCFLLLPLCPVYGLGMAAVLALPPMDRAVIHLFYYEGYSAQEIARITGGSQVTDALLASAADILDQAAAYRAQLRER